MSLIKSKIKRIYINGANDLKVGTVTFEMFEQPKHKKVSSTWVPSLLGMNSFTEKGDKLLEFYGLAKGAEFDNYYSLRGSIAESIIVNALNKKGYEVKVFKNGFDHFVYDENDTENKLNSLYKYFGGLPDIVYKKENEVILLEVKSKDMGTEEKIQTNPPQYEILQGKILGLLYGLKKITMAYVFFSDNVARKMYLSLPNPFKLETALEQFNEKMPNLKYKEDFNIINVEYNIDRVEILNQMKEAYKYAETFRQTLTVKLDELSAPLRKEIFALEREIEDELKR